MGVLYPVDYDCSDKELSDGHYVIMITHGDLDNLPCVPPEEKLVDIINPIEMTKLNAISDDILKTSMGYTDDKPFHYCTSLVFGVFDTYNGNNMYRIGILTL